LTEDETVIVVQFNKIVKAGPCAWCGREKELFDVVFQDRSFQGAFCAKDMVKALTMKLGADAQTPKPQPAAQAPANGPAETVKK
jgi:hypothetical protein